MKRWIFLLLLVAPPCVVTGQTHTMTIDEVLRRAEEVSPTARAIGLEVERTRATALASGLWPNPEVFFSREESGGVVERFSNMSWAIPLWGRLGIERASARSGLAAAEASADQGRVTFRFLVRNAFIDLLLAQEQAKTLEAGRNNLSGLVEVLRAREKAGESSGFDRMRAERALAEAEVDRLGVEERLASARAALGALAGLSPDGLEASGSLAASDPLPRLEQALRLARSRGDLRALDSEAEQQDRLARAARRRLVPEPVLTAGTKTTEGGSPDSTGPVLAVAFTLPLFDRGQPSRVARTEAGLLRTRREALGLQVEAEVTAAHAAASVRREAVAVYLGAADPENLVRIARAAYEAGEMRILELLDAYRTALDTRLRATALQADARKAEVALGRAIGRETIP